MIQELVHAIGKECLGGRIVGLTGRSQAAKPVPRATMDGVILDSIETTGVVGVGLELVALKTWEELHFTPILEALGMNPRAIATAQITPSKTASSRV